MYFKNGKRIMAMDVVQAAQFSISCPAMGEIVQL